MTPLPRELQSLKEAISRRDNCAKDVLERAREIVARLYVEGEIDAFQAIAREFTSLARSGDDVRERYAAEIAAIQREEADRKEREAILDAEMERKIKDHNEKIAAIVREAREQAGLYVPTPRPGDRLTAAQLRDAPDGTVVETNNNRSVYITKKGATWHDGGGFEWPALDGIYFLVSWGRA